MVLRQGAFREDGVKERLRRRRHNRRRNNQTTITAGMNKTNRSPEAQEKRSTRKVGSKQRNEKENHSKQNQKQSKIMPTAEQVSALQEARAFQDSLFLAQQQAVASPPPADSPPIFLPLILQLLHEKDEAERRDASPSSAVARPPILPLILQLLQEPDKEGVEGEVHMAFQCGEPESVLPSHSESRACGMSAEEKHAAQQAALAALGLDDSDEEDGGGEDEEMSPSSYSADGELLAQNWQGADLHDAYLSEAASGPRGGESLESVHDTPSYQLTPEDWFQLSNRFTCGTWTASTEAAAAVQHTQYTTFSTWMTHMACALPPAEIKEILGHQIYMRVHATHRQLAGKITGMILEQLETPELTALINNYAALQVVLCFILLHSLAFS